MNIDVKCDECDAPLDADMNQAGVIDVKLCSDCSATLKETAYKEGYDAGYDDGHGDGMREAEDAKV